MPSLSRLEEWTLRRYRRRLLAALDGPFDPQVSHCLDAVDALLDVRSPSRVRGGR